MADPIHSSNPLGWTVWRRGIQLGLQWVAIVFGATLAIWLLMGLIGWHGTLRALCAMGIGPLLALGGIAVWWVMRRPALLPPGIVEPPLDAESTAASAPRQTGQLRGSRVGGKSNEDDDSTNRPD